MELTKHHKTVQMYKTQDLIEYSCFYGPNTHLERLRRKNTPLGQTAPCSTRPRTRRLFAVVKDSKRSTCKAPDLAATKQAETLRNHVKNCINRHLEKWPRKRRKDLRPGDGAINVFLSAMMVPCAASRLRRPGICAALCGSSSMFIDVHWFKARLHIGSVCQTVSVFLALVPH